MVTDTTAVADTLRTGVPPHPTAPLGRLLADPEARERVRHVERLPSRAATAGEWPDWVPASLVAAMAATGATRPWSHQVAVAEHAWAGRSVVVATGTASGKSLGYLLPAISAAMTTKATSLYIAPTKALAGDQKGAEDDLRSYHQLGGRDLPAYE